MIYFGTYRVYQLAVAKLCCSYDPVVYKYVYLMCVQSFPALSANCLGVLDLALLNKESCLQFSPYQSLF